MLSLSRAERILSESNVEGRGEEFFFAEDGVEDLKELFTCCARLNLGRVVGLYEKVSGVCTGTDTSSLHKTAVWSDVSSWCSFVEMRMLSLCLENI